MSTPARLREILQRIDGRGYKAYKDIKGVYDFGQWTLYVDHVQGDPFAAPSRVRARVPGRVAGFPPELWRNRSRRVGLADYLVRAFAAAVDRGGHGRPSGMGSSGLVAIDRPGQEMLARTAVAVDGGRADSGQDGGQDGGDVEVRFAVGLPARGRTVLGRQAETLLMETLPRLVAAALHYQNLNGAEIKQWVEAAEDQDFLRGQLTGMGLVAFVAEGAVLPRESGAGDRPLRRPAVVPFTPPPGMAVTVNLPNAGPVRGMGIPAGVTLITGGGYHGKSTLLRALERGVYNHIPGDGREGVAAVPGAVKIRAEDGRRVEKVDISPFINNLPQGADTRRFSSDNASGSTSQAANIIEALEVGAACLLIDEDTSATNFMIRDRRMQALIPGEAEPITPFIDRVRTLYEERGVSSIIVVGGAGDYLDVADQVILMDAYRPREALDEAKAIAARYPSGRIAEAEPLPDLTGGRVPLPQGFDPQRGNREKVRALGRDEIVFGREDIDLSAVEQLVDPGQTRAVAEIIRYASRRYVDGRRTLSQVLDSVSRDLEREGLEIISPFRGEPPGDLAMPRLFEVAAAINRLRSLKIR